MVLGKVKFTGQGGYDSEIQHAQKVFIVGEEYECDGVDVGGYMSYYHIVGYGWFNTILFEDSPIFNIGVEKFWEKYYAVRK